MAPGGFRFDRFRLDPADRQLTRDDVPVEISGRYLDALALLVREQGRLVSKDRFLDEVWRGVPVTDEALTQCIKTLRKQLGDDAGSPRFIETVPKHGYRFIAPVESDQDGVGPAAQPGATPDPTRTLSSLPAWQRYLLLAAAGTVGAGLAGVIGGLFYGFVGASQPLEPGMGAVSVLLVLLCLTILAALLGGIGVSIGIALSGFASGRTRPWTILGGAAGGLLVGAAAKLLGLDAFNLLFGQTPGDITGAAEGALLGGAVGLGAWLGSRGDALPLRRSMITAGIAGAAAGMLIPLVGGRLMAGSLDLLAQAFPNSRLRLDQIGALFGEDGLGPISQAVTGGLEGGLFGACVVGAMILARRSLNGER